MNLKKQKKRNSKKKKTFAVAYRVYTVITLFIFSSHLAVKYHDVTDYIFSTCPFRLTHYKQGEFLNATLLYRKRSKTQVHNYAICIF